MLLRARPQRAPQPKQASISDWPGSPDRKFPSLDFGPVIRLRVYAGLADELGRLSSSAATSDPFTTFVTLA
jgi:hypothetical protein